MWGAELTERGVEVNGGVKPFPAYKRHLFGGKMRCRHKPRDLPLKLNLACTASTLSRTNVVEWTIC